MAEDILDLIKLGLSEIFLDESDAEIDERVSSSAVHRLTYDEDTKELTVYFNSGSVYTYVDVPRQKATYFIESASSKGKYFVRKIRNRYIYSRDL